MSKPERENPSAPEQPAGHAWGPGMLSPQTVPRGGDRYATLLDNALVWIFELDLEGNLLGSNLCGLQALDAGDATRVIHTPLRSHVPVPRRPELDRVIAAAARGEAGELECPLGRRGRWFGASFVPVKDAAGTCLSIMGIAQEITRRKDAEEALAEKELILRQMAEHINEAFWLCNLDRTKVEYLSPGFETIWGIPREDMVRDPEAWTRHIHPEDRDRVVRAREGQASGTFDQTYRILRADGRVRWIRDRAYPVFDDQGHIYRLTGIAEDITERVLAEQAHAASEARYRAFFNTMRDGIVFVSFGGEIEEANPAFLEMIGYRRDELKTLTYPKLTPDHWRRWEAREVARQLEQRGWSDTYEKEMVRRDGEVFPVAAQCWLMEGKEHRRSSMLVQVRDLTWTKRIELDKSKLEAQLLQAQKMETIGTLAGGIAHDFNNILTPILGFARMALEDDEEERKADLLQVLKAADRARELVKQILGFSRRDDQVQEPVAVYTVLREAERMLRSALPASIQVTMEVDDPKDLVLANPTQLLQVLLNLGTNAMHAMRDAGGTLSLTARRVASDGSPRVGRPHLAPGAWVDLEVTDTGTGIKHELLGHIFEAFFTTKDAGEGTGLGLSVVQSIIEKHRGIITVASTPAQGTTFHIYLPLCADDQAEVAPEQEAPGGHERILVVDDEPTITIMLKKMLERSGYVVATANHPTEALRLFHADPKGFDLLITDQIMPAMTGLDLSTACKRVRGDLPVLIITGFSEKVTAASCKEVGVYDYLIKPIPAPELARAVREALNSARSATDDTA